MVTFQIESDRYVPIGNNESMAYFEVQYGGILDVKLDGQKNVVGWKNGHPILIGDAQPKYQMTFRRAPNIVYDEILLLQLHAESIPGLENGQFVTIVEGSATLLNEDGSPGRVLNPGEFLPI